MRNYLIIVCYILSFLSVFSCSITKDNDTDIIGGDVYYSHRVPCFYSALDGLKPFDGIGFGIEPHTMKRGMQKRVVLMVDYNFKKMWSDYDEERFRETTGETSGSFLTFGTHPEGRILANWIEGISVTSSEKFNDIPAGESLASKLMFFTWSVWPSIKAGKDLNERDSEINLYYQYFHVDPIPMFKSYSPINKMLNALDEGDLYLLGADGHGLAPALFMFTELPDIKQHIFTITYHEGDHSWSLDIPADFSVIEANY